MIKINGNISFGFVTSNRNENWIEITITDDDAKVFVLQAKMSMEDFTLATIGRMSHTKLKECEVNTKNVGKMRESKLLEFPMPNEMAIEYWRGRYAKQKPPPTRKKYQRRSGKPTQLDKIAQLTLTEERTLDEIAELSGMTKKQVQNVINKHCERFVYSFRDGKRRYQCCVEGLNVYQEDPHIEPGRTDRT